MNPLVAIAERAAQAAGQIIVRAMDSDLAPTVHRKGDNDFTTTIDLKSEQKIIDTIKKAYPEHAIYAEESGITKGKEIIWIIDPLDGTSNFVHGYPHVSVSIAAMQGSEVIAGVVFDPIRQEMFSAAKGLGAKFNDKRIRVSGCTKFNEALVATGLHFSEMEKADTVFDTLKRMHTDCAGFRRSGSAALDLAYVACGRLDGFFEYGLKPWDVAAGGLIVREAGGYVSGMQREDNFVEATGIVAGSPKVYENLFEYL